MPERRRYGRLVLVAALVALAAAAGIVAAEFADRELLGGGLVGALLLAYAAVILFLRKGGFIAGR